ncbi:Clp protease ClpP [Chryseobacterium sp. H3056]|uniref:Clp protease ClpP n=1 Tax=Kaistella daneshvariae TaxID=2487074 RepID=A0A3N0X0I4_9FLAO|nr:Clp protease ClpP [Kaistella daneshvariae]ROI09789.1 Clp protease ClpP [Kaistella daneshvariae]
MHKKLSVTATTANSVLNLNISGTIYQGELAPRIKSYVDSALANNVNTAQVYINCVGGSVFEAQEAVNELKRISNVNLIVGALAASAATYIMCHFPAQCYATSQFMIHKPASSVFGNEDDVKSDLKALENLTKIYRTAYATKMGKAEDDVEAMWKTDYWMNAEEAMELGLVESIIVDEIEITDETITMMVACGCPNIPKQSKKENMSLVAIAAALTLPAQSTEAEVLTKVNALATEKTNAETERDQWKQKFEALQNSEASTLVDKAIALGIIPEDLKETTVGSFTAENFDKQKNRFEKLISDKEAANQKDGRHTAVASAVTGSAKGATGADAKESFDYLQKHNPAELRRISEQEPDKYQALADGYAKGVRFTS